MKGYLLMFPIANGFIFIIGIEFRFQMAWFYISKHIILVTKPSYKSIQCVGCCNLYLQINSGLHLL